MTEPNVIAVHAHGYMNDGYSFSVTVRAGDEEQRFPVTVSGSTSATAGFGDDGPTREWVAEHFRRDVRAPALDNYQPILPQIRDWVVRRDGRDLIALGPEPR